MTSTLFGKTPLPVDVVSIQSQVVYGSVGNSIAIPVLQSHGLTVCAVPTVVLSNTPHYSSVHGGAIPLDWFSGYLDDLISRDAVANVRALQLGYLGNAEQALVIARWMESIRRIVPGMLVHVDPVLGDHDCGLYVDPGLVDAYRQVLVPQAHGLTPNSFELQCLTGLTAVTVDDTVAAARTLLSDRTQWVVVTSAAPLLMADNRILLVVVTKETMVVVSHPKLPDGPKGTGDHFAAELTAHLLAGLPLSQAVVQASNAVVAAVEYAHRHNVEALCPPTTRTNR